jgi:hypothetical protein
MPRPPRERRVSHNSGAKASGSASIILRTRGQEFPLNTEDFGKSQPSLAHEAMRWSYALRSRRRWSDSEQDETEQASAAEDFLNGLGAGSDILDLLAQAGLVQVDLLWQREDIGWELRILPWEYLIAAATRTRRGAKDARAPLTVIRRLRVPDWQPPKFPPRPRVLFVASEPGPLRGMFEYQTERELVQSYLKVAARDWHVLDSPTAERLETEVAKIRPDIIHLSGFDTHFAKLSLLSQGGDLNSGAELDNALDEGNRSPGELSDGYVLAGSEAGSMKPVRPQDLGRILTGNKSYPPQLVVINIGNSAARIAPLVVAQGAYAATGFQDAFDDDLAELFFAVLYSRLGQGLSLTQAFSGAWKTVRIQPASSQGTGTALWTAAPLVRPGKDELALERRVAAAEQSLVESASVKTSDVAEHAKVSIEVYEDLNYSMLHNQRPLFRYFVVTSLKPRTICSVRVKVSLYSGTELAVYDRVLDVRHPFVDLKRDIHIPLTSLLTRSVHESVRTSLLIEVTWGEHVLYRDTLRIRLTPVDQWRDTDEDRKWLPSFVFPRDPATMRLVDAAQRYVRVLRDDPNAGFDGYQSSNVGQPKTLEQVDMQVQAIWSAIVYDLRLGYINPPPGYSRDLDSQRLRTPSMVVRDHSGTCIDLALFFAACLELVDIYPAIILLKDHAFPAYWRAEEYHDELKATHPENIEEIVRANADLTATPNAQEEAWLLGAATYREIVSLVNANKLVPIETVRLTENCGFWEAVSAGRDNLRVQRDFDSMIDIALAREKQITPLPILGEET